MGGSVRGSLLEGFDRVTGLANPTARAFMGMTNPVRTCMPN